MIQRVVKGVIGNVEPEVSGTGIGRAQRVKLLDGAVGVDHDKRARLQTQSLHGAMAVKYQLNHLGEQADLGLLLRC